MRAAATIPAKRLNEQGLAYVSFALKNPARFMLMFRPDKFDLAIRELQQSRAARSARWRARSVRRPARPRRWKLSPDGFGLLMAVWSIVHGFSHLALGGEFDLRGSAAWRQGCDPQASCR